jgi:hypothetical protein
VEDLTSIDTLATEKREELDAIYYRFNHIDGIPTDPLVIALNKQHNRENDL